MPIAPHQRWITIDPGVAGTGLAVFQGQALESFHTLHGFPDDDWTEKVTTLVWKVSSFIVGDIKKIYCEWPSNFISGGKGVAALNTNAIPKLSYLIGNFAQYARQCGIPFILVPVQSWKGQLPKEVVQKRAEAFFMQSGFKNHAADAVGIGQYVLEKKLL